MLSVLLELEPLDDVTVAAGAPLQVALRAISSDPAEELTYTATVENLSLTGGELSTYIPEGNRSMRINVGGFGSMTFELFEQRVPDATSELIARAESGAFDGQEFHRVAKLADGTPFVIQGGSPGTGESFDDQFHTDLLPTSAGILAMANRGSDTNDAQFFITGSPVRFLDLRYAVLGYQTGGEDVRRKIEAVETVEQNMGTWVEDSKPVEDIIITSVDIFFDPLNGTMTLSAPDGASGQAEVTVTVADTNGHTDQETFTVTVVPDSVNSPPYLLPIADQHTVAETPLSFQIEGVDIEGDILYYTGSVINGKGEVGLTVDPLTGDVLVSPEPGAAGVYDLQFKVRELSDDGSDGSGPNWDSQHVPLFVEPPAPAEVALLASTDTGFDDGDGLTNINNDGDSLRFRVSGVVPGAEVTVLAGGTPIGQGTAADGVVTVTTDGVTKLNDGPHTITAVQTLVDSEVNVGNRHETVDLGSGVSPGLEIHVDTAAPQFTNQPTLGAAEGVPYVYNAQTDDEDAGEPVRYSLKQSPAGMIVGLETGRVEWTPQAGQGPTRDVILVAEDAAGNRTELPFTLGINELPVLDPIGDQEVDEHSLLTFTAVATDDGGEVTYGLGDGAPAGAEIDPETGVFEWTPTEAQGPGEYTFAVEAIDETGLTASETITVTVDEVNVPPAFPAEELNWTLDEGDLWQWQPEVEDPDLPANDLTFALEGDVPDDLVFDPDTGEILWRPDEQAGGTAYSLRLSVADESGQGDELRLAIAVNETDQPPVVEPVPQQSVLPGGTVSVRVQAADSDTPANPVRFALQGDVPEGLTLDETTGRLDWDVPDDFPPGEVTVRVRAVEQTAAGDGLASEAQVDIQVLDLGALLFDAAFGQDGFSTALLPERPSSPIALPLMQPPADGVPAASARGSTRALLPALSLEDTGLFGSQIGPFTPSGKNGKTLQEIAEERAQKGDEESDDGGGKAASQRSSRKSGDENDGHAAEPPAPSPRASDAVWETYEQADPAEAT